MRLLGCIRANGPSHGNLTSQFRANLGHDALDHRVAALLSIGAYLRYVDDVALFSHSSEPLRQARFNCLSAIPIDSVVPAFQCRPLFSTRGTARSNRYMWLSSPRTTVHYGHGCQEPVTFRKGDTPQLPFRQPSHIVAPDSISDLLVAC